MNENIEVYFKELIKRYGNEVSLTDPRDNVNLEQIPVALHSLYQLTSKAKLPFGEIFDIDKALMQSERKPFKPNWFVFGKDNYFSFWLCSFDVDKEGLSFTYWDHESGNEIDGAVWSDIVSFLKDLEKENLG
jgi:hypothetical protein